MGLYKQTHPSMDTSSLLDLVSSPLEPKTVAGEGSDEEEEGEDIGDLGDLTVTPLSPTNAEAGEADEEESGEDIGDVLGDIQVTPIRAEAPPTTDDGEDLGDILENAKITPLQPETKEPSQPAPPSQSVPAQSSNTSQISHITRSIKRTKGAELSAKVPPEALGALADGFIETYEPALKKMQDMLKEYE